MRTGRVSSSAVRAALAASCLLVALPAAAQEVSTQVPFSVAAQPSAQQIFPQPVFPVRPARTPEAGGRPRALLPLYGSLVALQGLDIHSTRRALRSGSAREANPAMRPIVNNGAAFVAVKAGATAGVIWASERLWKKNRKAAVIFAGVVNVAMAAIVANNYRASR